MKITILAKRLKAARREKGLSQQELANLLGVSDKTVSAYESSRAIPPIPTLVKISSILRKDLNYFTANNISRTEKWDNLRLAKFEKAFTKFQKDVSSLGKKIDAIEQLLKRR